MLLELSKIYKIHSEPYCLGYYSNNRLIDLSEIYKITLHDNYLNSDFSESQQKLAPITQLRTGGIGEASFWIAFIIIMSLFQWVNGLQPLFPRQLNWHLIYG